MDEKRAINLLSQMYLPCFDEEEKQAITKAIESLETTKKLPNIIKQLKDKMEAYIRLTDKLESEYYKHIFDCMGNTIGECIWEIQKIYK